MDDLPGGSASVSVNGAFAGGVIGRPWRLDVTRAVKAGANAIEIVPQSPKRARLVAYPNVSR
jgi:hypothetical protein